MRSEAGSIVRNIELTLREHDSIAIFSGREARAAPARSRAERSARKILRQVRRRRSEESVARKGEVNFCKGRRAGHARTRGEQDEPFDGSDEAMSQAAANATWALR